MQQDPETPFDKFTPHLGTNYAPTETEVAELRALLEVSDGQIRALDEEIAHREFQLAELRKRREALKDSTKNHRALLSPIRRIPDDLLRDIFLACLPSNRCPTMSSDEGPMLLTQVSSWWRQVAHLTPRLWAAIHIPALHIPDPSTLPMLDAEIDPEHLRWITRQRIEAVNMWFQRSGLCPLRISLHERLEKGENSSMTQFMTECLIPVCRRWEDLSLTAHKTSLYHIQKLKSSQMPLLESLSLSFGENPQWGSTLTPWGPVRTIPWKANGILRCQRLTSLRISAVANDIPLATVNWEQLTTLTLDDISHDPGWGPQALIIPHMKSVLRKATALTSCTLHSGRMDRMDESTVTEEEDQPIELLFLEHLAIHEEEGASLLPLLRTPSVRFVSYRSNRYILGPSPLLQFLNSNIGVEIEEFVTNNQSMSAEDFIDCLRFCPVLRLLHVNTPTHPPRFMRPVYHPFGTNLPLSNEILTLFVTSSAGDTSETLCPRLEDIEFSAYEAKFSEADIVKFIERKQRSEANPGFCKLRTIKVAFGKKSRGGKDVMTDLKPYIDSGLKVEFKYRPDDSISPLSLYDGLDLEEGTGV